MMTNEFIMLHDINNNMIYFNLANITRFYKTSDFTTIITSDLDYDSVKESPEEILKIIRGK